MSNQKISRRNFLAKASIGALTVGFSGMGDFTAHSQSKKVVRVAVRPPTRLTPGLLTDSPGQVITGAYGDYLFRLEGPEQERQPSLVDHYESSSDKRDWTFKVKEGVLFHHGTELTADDVKYTFQRISDPDTGSPASSLFSSLDTIEKTDKYTVKFKLTEPDPDFPLKFYDYNTSILARDFDYESKGETKPSGTGAYMIKENIPGERLILERNPNYFVPQAPYIDELHFLIVPEIETQTLMLQSGDVDIVTFAGIPQFQRFKRSGKINADMVRGGFHAPISMRTDREPFNDNRVRLAIKNCVDRPSMIESVLAGYGDIGHDHPIAPVYKWYTDLGTRDQDIEKAKELLSEAGYGNGLDISLYYPTNVAPCPDTALNFQRMVKPAGINVRLVGTTSDIYFQKYWLKANMTCTQWAHRTHVLNLLKLAYKTGGSWNEGHYKNSTLDELIRQASTTLDDDKRQEYFTGIQEHIREQGPASISFHQGLYGGSHERIKDFWMVRTGLAELRYLKLS